jgi:hypothetical protein
LTIRVAEAFPSYDRTKSSVLSWSGKKVLALGTSITQSGFLELVAPALGFTLQNNGWAGSHNYWDITVDPSLTATTKALSMTADDLAYVLSQPAPLGPTSAYDDSFDTINKPSQQTFDYRVRSFFATTPYDVVILDHARNDHARPVGTLGGERITILNITKGATTQVQLQSLGTIVVGSAIALEVNGIPFLDDAIGRVQSIVSTTITLNWDSSGYSGSFVSGTAVKFDRSTIFGAFEFVIRGIRNCATIYCGGKNNVKIITAAAPTVFISSTYTRTLDRVNRCVKVIADAYGLAFFNVRAEYSVNSFDHFTYFPDGVHPTTPETLQAMANHWISWLSGGRQVIPTLKASIPWGLDKTLTDQSLIRQSRFLGGAGTPKYDIGDLTTRLQSDFAGSGLTGWTTITNAPTVEVAPWDAGQTALLFTAPASTSPHTSQISKTVSLVKGRSVTVPIYFPAVSGLTDSEFATGVTILELRSTGAYLLLGVIVRATTIHLRPSYFKTANATLVNGIEYPTALLPATKYDLTFEEYQAPGSDLGKLIVFLNGVLISGPLDTDDSGQGDVASVRIGAALSNTGKDFSVYFGEITVSDFAITDISAPYTGAGPPTKFIRGIAY